VRRVRSVRAISRRPVIEQHGASFELSHLAGNLARDCPRQHAASIYERCAARFVNVPRS
jgi:hypothetical protein